MGHDPYVYEGTNVLKNKLNLRDDNVLKAAEAALTTARLAELHQNPMKGNFDLRHLQKIHGYIFQDIYDWAGKIRTVDIAKSTLFCPVNNIDSYQQQVFGDLKKENYLQGLGQEAFSQQAAYLLGEVNMLHPFREGNGRTQREFMRSVALQAGYELNFDHVSKQEMLEASIQSATLNNDGLFKIIMENITPVPLPEFTRRLDEIKNFNGSENSPCKTAKQQYLQEAKKEYDKSGWLGKSVDLLVVDKLLRMGWEKDKVINTVVKCSPEYAGKENSLAKKVVRTMVNDKLRKPEIQRAIKSLEKGLDR